MSSSPKNIGCVSPPEADCATSGRKRLWYFMRVIVSLLLMGIVAWRVDWAEFWVVILKAHIAWLTCVIAASAFDRLWMAGKWHYLLHRFGVSVRFIETLSVYYLGVLVGIVAQWGLSGDITRAVRLARLTREHKKVAISVLVEKLSGFAASGVAAIGAAILFNSIHPIVSPALLTTVAVFAMTALATAPLLFFSTSAAKWLTSLASRLSSKFKLNFSLSPAARRRLQRATMVFFLLTLAEQTMPVLTLFLVQLSLGIEVGFLQTVAVIPIITFLSRLPISIDGLGIYEGLTVLLFGLMGMSAAEAFALAIVSRVAGLISVAIGTGVCLALHRPDKERKFDLHV